MNRRLMRITVAVGLTLTVGACGSGGGGTSHGAQTRATVGVTNTASSTGLGQFLVDGNGKTLYLFEADTSSQSTCSGDCAQTWPPFTTSAPPTATGAAVASLLGTTIRDDGTTQVTYHGHPLYYYVSDANPGDTIGEGLNCFGGVWDVVSPAGDKIAKSGG